MVDDFDIFKLAEEDQPERPSASTIGEAGATGQATLEFIILEDIAGHARNISRALQDYLHAKYGFDQDPSCDRSLPAFEIESIDQILIATAPDGPSLLRRFGKWSPDKRIYDDLAPDAGAVFRYGIFDQRLGGEGGLTGVETLQIMIDHGLILGGVVLSGYADPNLDIIPSVGLADKYLRKELYFGGTEEMRNLFVQQVALMAAKCVLKKLADREREIREQLLHTLPDLLIAMIYQKDLVTGVHSESVRDLALYLGKQLGLPENELLLLCFAAAVHDTGKIGIPSLILNKSADFDQREIGFLQAVKDVVVECLSQLSFDDEFMLPVKKALRSDAIDKSVAERVKQRGRLTAEERLIICTHPLHSAIVRDRYLQAVGEGISDQDVLAYVNQIFSGIDHHEHLDGSGYPHGLASDEISIFAQIIQVADIYEALVCSYRTYKKGYPHDTAIEILKTLAEENKVNAQIVDLLAELPLPFRDELELRSLRRLEDGNHTLREYLERFEKSPHFNKLLKDVDNPSLLEEYGIQIKPK